MGLGNSRHVPHSDVEMGQVDARSGVRDFAEKSRAERLNRRMKMRRQRDALRRSNKSWFMRGVCCSCLTVGVPFTWTAELMVDSLELPDEFQKLHIWEYYVKVTEQIETHAKRAGWWMHCLLLVRTTFNIILPAILALQNLGHLSWVIMWLTWALSLAVSLSTGYMDLFELQKNYELFTRTAEYMKLEGWQYFTLTSRYSYFSNHEDALHMFIDRIAKIRKRLLDLKFPPKRRDENLGGRLGGNGHGSGGAGGRWAEGSAAGSDDFGDSPKRHDPAAPPPSRALSQSRTPVGSDNASNESSEPKPPRQGSRARQHSVSSRARKSLVFPPRDSRDSADSISTEEDQRFEQVLRSRHEQLRRLSMFRRHDSDDDAFSHSYGTGSARRNVPPQSVAKEPATPHATPVAATSSHTLARIMSTDGPVPPDEPKHDDPERPSEGTGHGDIPIAQVSRSQTVMIDPSLLHISLASARTSLQKQRSVDVPIPDTDDEHTDDDAIHM
jgi:hypothetical protein